MLAGAWVLVLLPLMDALNTFGWASHLPVPSVFGYDAVRTLDDTLICWPGVYQPVVFCIGIVLLFSKERGRRGGQLDWTRRWGILCSYVLLLLGALPVLFIASLVMAGIAALCISMPLKYQPHATKLFVDLSFAYLRYGPYPKPIAGVVRVAFSSIAILLACIPLFNALASSGPKRLAATLLAPLALFSLLHLAQAGGYWLGISSTDVFHHEVYFWPELLVNEVAGLPTALNPPGSMLIPWLAEAVKWSVVLAIAVWFTIAQLAAWWQRKKTSAG